MRTISNKIINTRLTIGVLITAIFLIYSIINFEFKIYLLLVILFVCFLLYVILLGYKKLVLEQNSICVKYLLFKKHYSFSEIENVKIQMIGNNSHVNFIEINFKMKKNVFVLSDNDDIYAICTFFVEKKCNVKFIYNNSVFSKISKIELIKLESDNRKSFKLIYKNW